MSNYKTLMLSRDNRIATITLNRPEEANGLNLEMATELAQAAQEVASDDSLKAAVLTAQGRFFCAGGDVKAMHDAQDPGTAVKAIADQLHSALDTFSTMDIPLVCAINGTAAGAGFSLAVSGDMVIASESAKFTMAYSNIGLSPDGSASYYLPRLIGLRKTQELMFTNKVLSADDAQEWGLINSVCAADQVVDEATKLANMFAKGSKPSNKSIKALLGTTYLNTLEAQLQLESQAIYENANGVDGREGVKSFIEKRKPNFE